MGLEKTTVLFLSGFVASIISFCLLGYLGRSKSAIISFGISNVFMVLTILSACFVR